VKCPDWSGTYPDSSSMGIGTLCVGVKQPVCEVDHLPPASTKIKNSGRYTYTPHVCLHNVERNNFTLTFTYD
jgi:hypothetical protein